MSNTPSGAPIARYRVHLYATARHAVDVQADVADGHQSAMTIATTTTDLHEVVSAGKAEYAEEITAYLVDNLDQQGNLIDSVLYDGDMQFARQDSAAAIKQRLLDLEELASTLARVCLDEERLQDDGTIVADESAVLESDDAVETLGSLVRQARTLLKGAGP